MRIDRLAAALLALTPLSLVGPLVALVLSLASRGLAELDLALLAELPREAGRAGGLRPSLVATGSVLLLALALAAPVGLTAAVWLAELAPRAEVRRVSGALDALAAVPSVVFGPFGLALFCEALGLGWSVLSGGLTLAVMILPPFVRLAEEGLRAVPDAQRLAGAALGLPRITVVRRIVLPQAAPALGAALLLSTGRVRAESAALLFTAGAAVRTPTGPRWPGGPRSCSSPTTSGRRAASRAGARACGPTTSAAGSSTRDRPRGCSTDRRTTASRGGSRRRPAGEAERASGWSDSNRRPAAPKAAALPGCATPRTALPYPVLDAGALPPAGPVGLWFAPVSGDRMTVRSWGAVAALFVAGEAWASVDPACQGLELPEDYDEQAQQDFLNNYFALSSTYSPVHAPVPHDPGHGAIGLDVGIIPPLGCERRLVLNYTKTEDTNKSPVLPRPRVTFAFPAIGRMVPYAGFAYLPPIKLLGTTNVILSGEAGVGFQLGEVFQLGGRFHATSHKTVGEIATPFVEGDPAFDDLFLATTFGLDLMVGADLDAVTPYAALGFTDASTYFYIGDDGVVTNNFHPYFGPTASLGLDALVAGRLRLGGELYAAPGGYSKPQKDVEDVTPASRYGRLITGRFRVAVEL